MTQSLFICSFMVVSEAAMGSLPQRSKKAMLKASKRYQVETWTLCQGWVNCWTVNGEPQIFDTVEEAEAEISELLADIEFEIVTNEREADEGYDRHEFRIVEVP